MRIREFAFAYVLVFIDNGRVSDYFKIKEIQLSWIEVKAFEKTTFYILTKGVDGAKKVKRTVIVRQ